jgi:hypothetical protein
MGWERRNVGDSRRRTFIMLLAPHVLIMLCRCQIMTKYACSPGGNDRRYLNCPMQERTPYRICLGQLWAHSSPRIAIANPVGRRGSGSVACGVMSLTLPPSHLTPVKELRGKATGRDFVELDIGPKGKAELCQSSFIGVPFFKVLSRRNGDGLLSHASAGRPSRAFQQEWGRLQTIEPSASRFHV